MLVVKFAGFPLPDGDVGTFVTAREVKYQYLSFETEAQYLAWADAADALGVVEWPAGGCSFPQRIVNVMVDPPCDVIRLAPAGTVFLMNESGKTVDRL